MLTTQQDTASVAVADDRLTTTQEINRLASKANIPLGDRSMEKLAPIHQQVRAMLDRGEVVLAS